jgi:hypothetical protein
MAGRLKQGLTNVKHVLNQARKKARALAGMV